LYISTCRETMKTYYDSTSISFFLIFWFVKSYLGAIETYWGLFYNRASYNYSFPKKRQLFLSNQTKDYTPSVISK
jgi:hypothetical protein